MNKPIRFLSVCSGIEAATQAVHPLGWQPVGFAEIDPFASAVLAHHHGSNMPGEPLAKNGVPNFGDFTAMDLSQLGPVDVLVGGTPCQDFSIAGLRAGLDGDRGNLTLEFLRTVDRVKPEWVWWENVPGVISDKTQALAKFLDGLESLGYVIEIDILDAQFFGLAQRRRRVFVCAQRSDAILKQRTITSALTIAQCLLECLRLVLLVARDQSQTGFKSSASENLRSRHSLQRRMTLFALGSAAAVKSLAGNLAVLQAWSETEQSGLGSARGSESTKTSGATESPELSEATEAFRAECLSIEPSWKPILAECLGLMKSCITSTGASAITEQKIYSCAQAALRISGLITQSMDCSPTFWSAASSALTATKEFMNYARSSSSDLFGDMGWVRPWGDFIEQAKRTSDALGNLRVESFGKVISLSEGLRGHPPARGKAREDAAPDVEAGAGVSGAFGGGRTSGPIDQAACLTANGGGQALDFEVETFLVETAPTLPSRSSAGGGLGTDHDLDGGLIAHALRGEGFGASEDGTGRGTPIVQMCFMSNASGDNLSVGYDVSPTLRIGGDGGNAMALAYAIQERAVSENPNAGPDGMGVQEGISYTLEARQQVQAVAFTTGIEPKTSEGLAFTLLQPSATGGGQPQAVAFYLRGREGGAQFEGPHDTANIRAASGGSSRSYVAQQWAVRRLTPLECSRLQGFPDDHARIPWRGKPADLCPDGPQYKTYGNSMAVNVMRWIGQRLDAELRKADS